MNGRTSLFLLRWESQLKIPPPEKFKIDSANSAGFQFKILHILPPLGRSSGLKHGDGEDSHLAFEIRTHIWDHKKNIYI